MKREQSQELLGSANRYFCFILRWQKTLLLCILLLALLTPLLINFFQGKPLLMGEETYYHLSAAQPLRWTEYRNDPLLLLVALIPEEVLFLLPPLLALGSFFLIYAFFAQFGTSERFRFFYLLFLVMSPAFIFSSVTLSAYGFFFLLFLLGLWLFHKEGKIRFLSVVPFFIAAFFDLLSAFLLLLSLFLLFYFHRKEKSLFSFLFGVGGILYLVLRQLFFETPLIYGPFHAQQQLSDLITLLGGLSGLSFFVLLLAGIGVFAVWKRAEFSGAYVFLPVLILAYLYNTEALFFLALVVTFFATAGFIRLFDRTWVLVSLKQFTFLLLGLGILFSMLTYLGHVSEKGPSAADEENLRWVRENLPAAGVVFSVPEDSYYVAYFSQREFFYEPHTRDPLQREQASVIIHAAYIGELFPLLDAYNITVIYVSSALRSQLLPDEGLLFLLQNERFKMVHSSGAGEVWVVEKE